MAAARRRAAQAQRLPPGPRGSFLLGSMREAQRDPLRLYTDAHRQYGDVVRIRALSLYSWYLVVHPRDLEHVLVHNQRNYIKGDIFTRALEPVTGRGLFTNEGDSWLRNRRLIQPTFHRGHVAGLADSVIGPTRETESRWLALAGTEQPVDVLDEMTRLTMQAACHSLFGADVSGATSAISHASRVVFEHANYRMNTPFRLPTWAPTRRNRRFIEALRVLDQTVYGIIEERRQRGADREDLLGLLMAARDEDGSGMDDGQLRDELVTLLLAGHETTAAALSWTWYLLAQHPEAETRLHAELEQTLNGREPTVDDLGSLPYTERVIQESMRLYPPAWGMARQAVAADELGGYTVPKGGVLTLGTFLTHRHPEFWDEPDRFDPDRFSPERSEGRPRLAYLPFGAGARQCVGASFAMLETRLVLATLAQRVQLKLAPGQTVDPDPTFTLRPRDSLLMTLHAR